MQLMCFIDKPVVNFRFSFKVGTDYNSFIGYRFDEKPGHEIGGEILEVGAAVSPEYKIGARVIVMPYTNCGQCSSCRKVRLNACRYNKTLGVQQNGGLADEIVLPAEKLILNDSLPPRHLALVEPLSVGFHAVERGRVTKADRVAVLGCGMIGPVSHPGPPRHAVVSNGSAVLFRMIVLLSCCAP